MKRILCITQLGIVALLAGCATSSSVEEMIAASQQDYSSRLEVQEKALDDLKLVAINGFETSTANKAHLNKLDLLIDELEAQLDATQDYSEAAKMMSAANTVKLGTLSTAGDANHAALMELTLRLTELNKLYERVMLGHYQNISDSAQEAIKSLKENKASGFNNQAVEIDEPIEIVAPSTVVP